LGKREQSAASKRFAALGTYGERSSVLELVPIIGRQPLALSATA
jgi:hypothetical protein